MARSSVLGICSLQGGMGIMQGSSGGSASFLHSIPLPCILYGQSRYSIATVFGYNTPQSCGATRPWSGGWTGGAWEATPTGTPPGSPSLPSVLLLSPTYSAARLVVGLGGSGCCARGIRSRSREKELLFPGSSTAPPPVLPTVARCCGLSR